jgi:hypothetical protein
MMTMVTEMLRTTADAAAVVVAVAMIPMTMTTADAAAVVVAVAMIPMMTDLH